MKLIMKNIHTMRVSYFTSGFKVFYHIDNIIYIKTLKGHAHFFPTIYLSRYVFCDCCCIGVCSVCEDHLLVAFFLEKNPNMLKNK